MLFTDWPFSVCIFHSLDFLTRRYGMLICCQNRRFLLLWLGLPTLRSKLLFLVISLEFLLCLLLIRRTMLLILQLMFLLLPLPICMALVILTLPWLTSSRLLLPLLLRSLTKVRGLPPPLKEGAGSSQTTVSPRFSSFLRQEVASGGAEAVSSKNKRGELVC